ncbi:ArsR/SmtB family transcription factor [Bisgaardia hudsonensis]|uniref:ArsR/SmtB family transcription factor n=1 Tax=Bisgaardia hudsonensis TaxID=109472 RepID=UPI003AB98025
MEGIKSNSDAAVNFLKPLSNPNRLAILCCLMGQKRNVTELTQLVELQQAVVSNQLSILKVAGFVDCDIKHRERLYYIKDERVEEVIKLLYTFFCDKKIND